ncbi:hypothetical protein PSECIP111951_00369 [Pseudoalteromonas holothuriae]|uniref:DUF3630 domain-containing protein n=1 Tax=Pseudoalteromonas holothuriae TaxID=2963714 RepID=A0A9W4VQW8_9GAMM|nr:MULTISPECIES: DUF3630 family protein [unclassified Pseudoalteromonas]CAH9049617.1 hypothetical protein PSECIP111854_00263 [Pseudoalteromonas sp. CIP111854]CAH9051324.1 hypothetical protein PSECIP111951_00369 [Pseudoalteromonas sp. CIP111951]
MSHIELDSEHQVLIITPSCLPAADEFELWGEIFLHNSKHIQMLEFSQGVDRHQWRFSYTQHNFNLNFEHYSDSIWIAPEGADSLSNLINLAQLFLSNS